MIEPQFFNCVWNHCRKHSMSSFTKKMKMKSLSLMMIWMILVSVVSELCASCMLHLSKLSLFLMLVWPWWAMMKKYFIRRNERYWLNHIFLSSHEKCRCKNRCVYVKHMKIQIFKCSWTGLSTTKRTSMY